MTRPARWRGPWPIAGGARDFDGIDDVINCGSAGTLDNVNTFTYTAWVNPDTSGEGGNGSIYWKSTKFWNFTSTDTLRIQVERMTASADARAADSTMVLDTWQFVAAQFQDAAGYPKLFRGSVGGEVAEVSYAIQAQGSGTINSDAAGSLLIGNNSGGTGTWDGALADLRLYDVILSLAELKAVQRGWVVRPEALRLWQQLYGIVSPEPDWSGNANNGTLTGTIKVDDPPGRVAVPLLYGPRKVQVVPAAPGGGGRRTFIVDGRVGGPGGAGGSKHII